jgi:hypothetical protein
MISALSSRCAEWPGTFASVLRCREQRADLSDGLDVKTGRSYQFREARLGQRSGDLHPSLKRRRRHGASGRGMAVMKRSG